MGAFFRRILAFLLGFIMSFVAVFGGLGLGAYWAYKNLSISTLTGDPDEDPVVSNVVDRMTIEDFVADLRAYMGDPNSYTVGELEEKYGVDLSGLMGDFAKGDEYKNIQLLALFTGDTETLLGSVNLNVILGAFPDGMLSDKAKAQFGKHSVLDLVKEGDLAEKLNDVFGTLEAGDLLGIIFDEVTEYDENGKPVRKFVLKDEIKNSVGNEGLASLASVIGGVEISAVVRAASSSYENNLLDEIMNYGLTDVGDIDIGKFLADFIPESVDLPVSIEKMFGGKTFRDIISGELHDYSIDPVSLLSGMTVASIMGYETNDDGVLVDKKGEPVTGLLKDIADLNVGDIIAALITTGGDSGITTKQVIDYVLGEETPLNNVTVGSFAETILGVKKEDGVWKDKDGNPLEGILASASALFDINVLETVRLFTGEEGFTLDKLADVLDGISLGDFVNPILKIDENEEQTGINALIAGVGTIEIAEVIRGINELSETGDATALIEAVAGNGLGDVELGTVLGYTKDGDGNWVSADGGSIPALLEDILGYSIGGVLDALTVTDADGKIKFDIDPVEIIDYLLSDISVKDIIVTFAPDIYERIANVLPDNIVELLETSIGYIVKCFDPDRKEEFYFFNEGLTVNDALKIVNGLLEEFVPAVTENKYYLAVKDLISDLVGEAVLVETYPLAFTPGNVPEMLLNRKIDGEIVPALEKFIKAIADFDLEKRTDIFELLGELTINDFIKDPVGSIRVVVDNAVDVGFDRVND
ncbi:MAG: hypothetical protein IJR61_01760, partial [Clostridia bacterium]|nr:hypothetical protein [Clostridia bacterium]